MSVLNKWISALLATGLWIAAGPALAQDSVVLSGGNTAWILTATALVLFMTMPGLALFYGGLVRSRNVVSVLMHCFAICCMASVLWLVCTYSLAFGDGGPLNSYIGGFGKSFLAGVSVDAMSGDIPETVFFMFQMTFAVITPALIVGAYGERIKFSAVILFSLIWSIVVYAPVAHWVWGGGWLAEMGIQDFAGGLVVHMTCGISALVIAAMLGSRKGFPNEIQRPHNPGLGMIGAAMLWVGWYGFNAGSALAATAALTWMLIEWLGHGKPTLVGIATGTIAGLATITPASGFVGPVGALFIGIAAGVVCFYMCGVVKNMLKIDDSLDVFAVHGVGGAMGTLLTAIFGAASLGGLGHSGLSIGSQFGVQLTGVIAVLIWSAVLTFVIVKIVQAIVGLRASSDEEIEGLDVVTHGERGYEL